MTFLFFDLKVHFFFNKTREAFFAKKYQFFIFLWLFIFIEDFMKDFTDFAAKPPAERSEANKKCIYLYTVAKPPSERSEANKVSIYLYIFSTRHLQCPSGVQRTKPYDEREARV